MSTILRQKKQLGLEKMLNNYLSGQYATDTDVFDILKTRLEGVDITENTLSQISKFVSIFFCGQLVDLPTLNRILVCCGIKSNCHQKKDKKICKSLTNKNLHNLYEQVFEACLFDKLRELLAKDSSALSRELVTVLLDDSVFKQWLSSQKDGLSEENRQFYGKAFSGQMQQVVWGYQVVTIGLNIDGVFFPLRFECVRKTALMVQEAQVKYEQIKTEWKAKCAMRIALLAEINAQKAEINAQKAEINAQKAEINAQKAELNTDEAKIAFKGLKNDLKVLNIEIKCLKQKIKSSKPPKKLAEKHEIANKLIGKAGDFLRKVQKEFPDMPVFQFSCDSGYSHSTLLATCTANLMNYISVPKKSHLFTIDDQKQTLKTWLNDTFLAAEAVHNIAQATLPADQKTDFTIRKRVCYHALEQDVTLLAFRLPNSKKVTAIYTPQKNIFAKTLRRHWFARTQIEQFFKLLKHYMHIEQPRPRKKHIFEYILLRFAYIALQIQHLIRFLRRKQLLAQNEGLGTLRTLLATSPFIKERLINLLK
jgi:hypothetical protein